jgi:hypothetical protein
MIADEAGLLSSISPRFPHLIKPLRHLLRHFPHSIIIIIVTRKSSKDVVLQVA